MYAVQVYLQTGTCDSYLFAVENKVLSSSAKSSSTLRSLTQATAAEVTDKFYGTYRNIVCLWLNANFFRSWRQDGRKRSELYPYCGFYFLKAFLSITLQSIYLSRTVDVVFLHDKYKVVIVSGIYSEVLQMMTMTHSCHERAIWIWAIFCSTVRGKGLVR
jgi:hypothetical protein